ncbi:MAG: hypothetical protein ABI166_11695 [Mucilaginibacter sp.]
MKSKFSGWAYFLAFYASIFTGLLLLCFLADVIWNNIMPAYFYFIISGAVIFVWTWVVFGELRNKVISIEIGYNSITIKRYLGLGPSKVYYFEQLDGYKTSILASRAVEYEYLYIMAGDKKIAKLSEYYHKNYKELKEMLTNEKFKDLGFEDYNSTREIKEIFV